MLKRKFIGAIAISSLLLISTSCEDFDNDKKDETTILKGDCVTINEAIGGIVICKNPLQNNVGSKIYLEVETDSNYYLEDLKISSGETISFEGENLYSFTLKEGKNIVTPYFAQKSETMDCTLFISHNEFGKITILDNKYLAKSPLNFVVTPNEGYKVESILFNNEQLTLNSINTYSVTLLENFNFLDANFIEDTSSKEDFSIVDNLEIITKVVNIDFAEEDDPYEDVTKEEFYENYSISNSYEDSYFRSKHYLMSGDITPQKHIPSLNYELPFEVPMYEDSYLMNSLCRYEVDQYGNYISYTVNTLDNTDYKIYYGGGYSSLEDVSAYLFAFGDIPANHLVEKKASSYEIESTWGEYLRLNQSDFSGDTERYPYEPELTGIFDKYKYYESDFGSIGGFTVSNPVEIYNNGHKIDRGTCRFVYNYMNLDETDLDLNNRHVFYTYNHYNDFQEYLNYKGGFTARFGNETAGNPYGQVIGDNKPTNPYKIVKAQFNFPIIQN